MNVEKTGSLIITLVIIIFVVGNLMLNENPEEKDFINIFLLVVWLFGLASLHFTLNRPTLEEKKKRFGRWHKWFSWYPIDMDEKKGVWMRMVERKGKWKRVGMDSEGYYGIWNWQYKKVIKK